MFVQNFIQLSAAVRELLWSQSERKTLTKTILFIDTADSKNTKVTTNKLAVDKEKHAKMHRNLNSEWNQNQ